MKINSKQLKLILIKFYQIPTPSAEIIKKVIDKILFIKILLRIRKINLISLKNNIAKIIKSHSLKLKIHRMLNQHILKITNHNLQISYLINLN